MDEYVRIGKMITVGIGEKTYILSKEQVEFLMRIAKGDLEYLDKMREEKESMFYRRVFKLRRKGLISPERGFPYKLSEEGEKVVKVLERYYGGKL